MNETQQERYEDVIHLLDVLKVILKHKKMIIFFVLICTIGTAMYSLLMTKIYESKAVIVPIGTPAAQSGMAAIAAQFGMMTPESANVTEIVGLLKSNVLMQRVMEKGKFYEVLFKAHNLKEKSENEKVWMGIRCLKESILKITENKKDNIINISAQYKDPVIAQKIVSTTLSELTEHMTAEAKRVADANKLFLDKEIITAGDPFVRQKIYALIAQQIETATMAAAKENFAFKIIDPPMIPDKRIKPKRTSMVLIAFFVSLVIGIFGAFAREHLEKNGSEWREILALIKKPRKNSAGKESIV